MQPSEAERSVGYLVKRVQQGLRRRCDSALRPTGLSMAQYSTLRALHEHPDASAAELARLRFVTRQCAQDGARRLSAAHDAVFAVEAVMLQDISARDRRTVAEVLLRCAENVEDA